MSQLKRKVAHWVPKLVREALSLTGLLTIVAALTAATSWSFGHTVAVLVTIPLLFASYFVWAFQPQRALAGPPQWSLRRMFVIMTSVAVLTATIGNQAPFRLRFALSQSSLDRLADRIEKGEPVGLPQRCGLFVVYKADSVNEGQWIRLQIDCDPGEFTGFVRLGSAWPYRGNEWYSAMLDDRWQYFEED